MSEEFYHFAEPADRRRFARWTPGKENAQERSSDGVVRPGHFERPFDCVIRESQLGDIVWGGSSYICLVRDHVVEAFQQAGFSGFELRDVRPRFMFPCKDRVPVFRQLLVTGWGGVAPSSTGIRPMPDPQGLGRLCYTHCMKPDDLVDLDQWDGSDFFIVWPLPLYWIVTARVATLLRDNNFKWSTLTPLGDLSFTSTLATGFIPGRLEHYFDEDRARSIGGPLGID